ncbi:DUF4296 domain-containing protein [Bacteroidales bacterium OttesenSCG-928-L03]|nr:DUF4296 domain-containing protein [Bacteroidales bacterium OttesenSCG-928-L03]
MKNKLLPILVLFVVLWGCSDRPSRILSDKKTEDVLYDLYLADAIKDEHFVIFNNDSARKQALLDEIFAKHKISEETFDSTLVWYAGHLDKYVKVLERVSARYTEKETALRAIIDARPVPSDDELRTNLLDTPYFAITSPRLFNNRFVFDIPIFDHVLVTKTEFKVGFDIRGVADSIMPELHFHVHARDTIFRFHEPLTAENSHVTQLYTIPSGKMPNRVYGYIEVPDSTKHALLFTRFRISVK